MKLRMSARKFTLRGYMILIRRKLILWLRLQAVARHSPRRGSLSEEMGLMLAGP
jgi:hypothetical protein